MNQTEAQTLGDEMRAIRKSARASIEQAESDLRIKAKYIEAIEAGDAAALPSRVYADGFLRNYATYLGLDPETVLTRFYAESGIERSSGKERKAPKTATRTVTVDPLSGITGLNREQTGAGIFRSIAALWPLVLIGGLGVGAYAGYNYANAAGLIPVELGGTTTETQSVAKNTAENANKTPEELAAKTADAEPKTPEKSASLEEAELVGGDDATGGARPDSLSYARSGNAAYWQAKAPSVEPTDGPIADIEPESAGVIPRRGASDSGRWTVPSSGGDSEPSAEDASRIAEQARKALADTLGLDLTTPPAEDPAPREPFVAPNDEPDFGGASDIELARAEAETAVETEVEAVAETASAVEVETQIAAVVTEPANDHPAIGPVVVQQPSPERETQTYISTGARVGTQLDPTTLQPAPAEPYQPGRFVIHAQADAWIQVHDSNGEIAYTGILSDGESYTIPNRPGLQLKTGNAGGILIEVDGQRFGPLGSDGAIMRNVPLNAGAIRASYQLARQATLSQ